MGTQNTVNFLLTDAVDAHVIAVHARIDFPILLYKKNSRLTDSLVSGQRTLQIEHSSTTQ